MGEMRRVEGQVTLHGNISYAPQNPWYAQSTSDVYFVIDNRDAFEGL